MDEKQPVSDVMMAGIEMLRRSGQSDFQLGFFDDVKPIVWVVMGHWNREGREHHVPGCGLTPEQAVMDLCERVMDGGKCTHCDRVTAFHKPDEPPLPDFMTGHLCYWEYHEDAKRFLRGCWEWADVGECEHCHDDPPLGHVCPACGRAAKDMTESTDTAEASFVEESSNG